MKKYFLFLLVIISVKLFSFNEWNPAVKIRESSYQNSFLSLALGDGIVLVSSEYSNNKYWLKARFIGAFGEANWPETGIVIDSSLTDYKIFKVLLSSDNAIFVVWSSIDTQAYKVQKLDLYGNFLWTTQGINLEYGLTQVISDNNGGLYTICDYPFKLYHCNSQANLVLLGTLENLDIHSTTITSFFLLEDDSFMISYQFFNSQRIAKYSLTGSLIECLAINNRDQESNIYPLKMANNIFSFIYQYSDSIFIANTDVSCSNFSITNITEVLQNIDPSSALSLIKTENNDIIIAYQTSTLQLQAVQIDIFGNNIWTMPLILCNNLTVSNQTFYSLNQSIGSFYCAYSLLSEQDNKLIINKYSLNAMPLWTIDSCQISLDDEINPQIFVQLSQDYLNASFYCPSKAIFKTQFINEQGQLLLDENQCIVCAYVRNTIMNNIKIINLNDKAFCLWNDQRNNTSNIYYQILTASGQTLLEKDGRKLSEMSCKFLDAKKDINSNIVILASTSYNDELLYKLFVIDSEANLIGPDDGLTLGMSNTDESLILNDPSFQLILDGEDYYIYWNVNNPQTSCMMIKGQKVHNNHIEWGENAKVMVDKSINQISSSIAQHNLTQNYLIWHETDINSSTAHSAYILRINSDGEAYQTWDPSGLRILQDLSLDYYFNEAVYTPEGVYLNLKSQTAPSTNYLQIINPNSGYFIDNYYVLNNGNPIYLNRMLYHNDQLSIIYETSSNRVNFQNFIHTPTEIVPLNEAVDLFVKPTSSLTNRVSAEYMYNRLFTLRNVNSVLAMNLFDEQINMVNNAYTICNFNNQGLLTAYQYAKINNSEFYIAYIQGFLENDDLTRNDLFVQRVSTSSLTETSDFPWEKANTIISNAYPNPFNPSININLSIKTETDLELSIFNLKGQKIAILHQGKISAGNHVFNWFAKDKLGKSLASGVYFYRIKNLKYSYCKRILLLK